MIQHTIKDEIKKAMIAKDSTRLMTLRGVIDAFQKDLLAKKSAEEVIGDEDALTILRRLVKQRKDSIEQFMKGGRADLADAEKTELTILETFLPSMMSQDDIQVVATIKKAELGVTDKKDAGKLMASIMKDLKGKADGGDVKAVVDMMF